MIRIPLRTTALINPPFKIGDKVICFDPRSGLTLNAEYTIYRTWRLYNIWFVHVWGNARQFKASRFKLSVPALTEEDIIRDYCID